MTKPINDYTQQMDWISDDPPLLTWQIKTIAHDVKKLEYFCIFILSACIVVFFYLLIAGYYDWGIWGLPIVGILITCVFLFGEVRRKVWLVYRCTSESIEICRWRAYPKALFTGIRYIFIGFGVLAIIIGLIADAGFMVLAGPIGIALGLGSIAVTKSYEETMRAFMHLGCDWSIVTEANYDDKKQVIHLFYVYHLTEQDKAELIAQGHNLDSVISEVDLYLFLTADIRERAIDLVEKSLPNNVPLKRTKVTLPTVV